MSFDWLAGMAAQDRSIESMMARQDLQKKLQLVMQVAKEAEDRHQFDKRQALDEKHVGAQIEHNKLMFQSQEEARKKSDTNVLADNQRLRVNSALSAPPGSMITDPKMIQDFNEQGMSDRLTPPTMPHANEPGFMGPIEQAPPNTFILDKQEAERLDLDRKHREERAAEDQKMQEEARKQSAAAFKLQQEEFKERQKDREQIRTIRQKKFDDAHARLKTLTEAIPVHLRPAIKAEAEQIIKDGTTWWNPIDKDVNEAEAWVTATQHVREQAILKGEMQAGPSPVNRGSQETEADRVRRLLGAGVKPKTEGI